MAEPDAELRRLFAEELDRHLATLLDPGSSPDERRRALHALKGSAGLVGELPLAEALSHLERRARDGDARAFDEAVSILLSAKDSLSQGSTSALRDTWPAPPPSLLPRPLADDPLEATYEAEMHDRLARLEEAVAHAPSPGAALAAALREVHGIKGAAGAIGDEAMAWFCHGLEERLRPYRGDPAGAARGLAELSSFRGVLAELAADPSRALDRLRGIGRVEAPPRRNTPVASASLASLASLATLAGDDDVRDGSVRIPSAALDRLVERMGELNQASAQIAASTSQARRAARALRQTNALLHEALRLIGPPRPWGAPALALSKIGQGAQAAARVADGLERSAGAMRSRTEDMMSGASQAATELRGLRRTAIGPLLERVRQATLAQARREGRPLRVQVQGATLPVDRHLLEQLLDPLLQLARNALAHGIEPPEVRASMGKQREGTLILSASLESDVLRVLVEDDGAGVDTSVVRKKAVASGLLPDEVAAELDDAVMLELLFAPGFTTRPDADLLAGRGMGLDLAMTALRRLGGSIRLSSTPGRGMSAMVELPVDPGVMPVLWVEAMGSMFAVPARQVARVDLPSPDLPCPHLRSLLSPSQPAGPGRLAIELTAARGQTARLGVDEVGEVADVTLRAISPLIRAAGPYRGAVAHADGRLHLVLDVEALLGLLP